MAWGQKVEDGRGRLMVWRQLLHGAERCIGATGPPLMYGTVRHRTSLFCSPHPQVVAALAAANYPAATIRFFIR